jgi:hypothetical protein
MSGALGVAGALGIAALLYVYGREQGVLPSDLDAPFLVGLIFAGVVIAAVQAWRRKQD